MSTLQPTAVESYEPGSTPSLLQILQILDEFENDARIDEQSPYGNPLDIPAALFNVRLSRLTLINAITALYHSKGLK
jgi:hypothetical protein